MGRGALALECGAVTDKKTPSVKSRFVASSAALGVGLGAVLVVVLALGLGLVSCREAPTVEPVPFPLEQVFADESVLVAPGRRWRRNEAGAWTFRGKASLYVYVHDFVDAPLGLLLRPDAATSQYLLRVEWDGEKLFPEPIAIPADGFRLDIPRDKLGRGVHTLTLTRRRPPHDPFENVFVDLGYDDGSGPRRIDAEDVDSLHYLAEFLGFGSSGLTQEKFSGFLFAGPRGRTVSLQLAAAGAVSVRVENASDEPAEFVLQSEGVRSSVEVAPRQRGELRALLPKGSAAVTFEARGAAEGLFLWGAPWLEQGRGDDVTPIILLTVDTTRRDALSPYGADPELTPHLGALAEVATVYERAFSTAPWTLPSHGSMMTGLYPSKHGLGVSKDRLVGIASAARRLREAGYLTAGFAGGDLSSHRFGIADGFHLYRDPDRFETRGDRLTDYAEGFLERYHEEPFFLFVNYFDAHGPYRAPPEYEAKVGLDALIAAVKDQPVWGPLARGDNGAWQAVGYNEVEATPEGIAYLRAAYLAEVAYMDAQIGRLFATLERLDLFDRALIVVLADHGELLGEGGRFNHAGRLDPELTAVPLLVKRPGQKKGERSQALVSSVDVFPTLLAVAGLAPPATDGVALEAELLQAARRGQVFSEEHEARVHPIISNLKLASHVYGVQRLDFRQVVWRRGSDCARREGDAWQPTDCPTDGEEVLRHLETILHAPDPGEVEGAGVVSPEVEESLRALGYL